MADHQQPTAVPSFTREVFVPNYKKHIGVDAFSNVFKVRIRSDIPHVAAGKLMALKLFKEDESVLEDVKSVKSRELRILQALGSHDFILRFYGMYLNQGLFVGLLYEYADLGTWDDFIYEHMIDNNQNFYAVRCYQAECLASGLAHLHSRNIIHGDVFIENALVFAPQLRTKIANFGSSYCSLDTDEPPSWPYTVDDMRSFYLAPEKRITGDCASSFETDAFSFGVMLYFAFIQKREDDCLAAYTESWDLNKFRSDLKALVDKEPDFPQVIASIIARCLKLKPKERIAIEDAKNALNGVVRGLASTVDEQLQRLSALIDNEAPFVRMHSSTSGHDLAFALSRPMSLASQFSAHPLLPPVSGAAQMAVSPLSPYFPAFEKRGLVDPYLNDLNRADVSFQRATSYLHSNYSPLNVEHKSEDIDKSKLQGATEKPTEYVIKSIMHHPDIQKKWRTILLHLGMKENDLRLVEERAREHRHTSDEVDHAAIVHYALDAVWLEQKFGTATRAQLLDALLKSECYDSAFTFINLDYELD